jgi:hypothetical protein
LLGLTTPFLLGLIQFFESLIGIVCRVKYNFLIEELLWHVSASATMSTSTFENDPEKGTNGKSLGQPDSPELDTVVQMNSERQPWNRRIIDSFKRDPNAHVTKLSQRSEGGEVRGFDHKAAAERTANSGLAHKLKARHMQMIAIGGSIGES